MTDMHPFNNSNLRASQKELLLWHQRLSHCNLPAIRSLMLPKKRLPTDDPVHPALHDGPILPIKLDATARVNTSCVKCGPCLMAKARCCLLLTHVQISQSQPPTR
jgi:hypothetical protein